MKDKNIAKFLSINMEKPDENNNDEDVKKFSYYVFHIILKPLC